MRSLEELRIRAAYPLKHISQELRNQCVGIARTRSPSATFDLSFQAARVAGCEQQKAKEVAKATRWLAMIRRNYGQDAFDKTVEGW